MNPLFKTKTILYLYVFWVIFQNPLQSITGISFIDWFDEILISVLFLNHLYRNKIKPTYIKLILAVGFYYFLSTLINYDICKNYFFIRIFVAPRDTIELFLFYSIVQSNNYFSSKDIRNILLWILKIEIFINLFQINDAFINCDLFFGTLGPGGSHGISIIYAFFLIVFFQKFIEQKKYMYLGFVLFLLSFLVLASFRTLFFSLPIILVLQIMTNIHSRKKNISVLIVITLAIVSYYQIKDMDNRLAIELRKYNLSYLEIVLNQQSQNSSGGRLMLWDATLDKLEKNNLFFGLGPGNWGTKTSTTLNSNLLSIKKVSMMQYAVVLGELGLIGFILIYFVYFNESYKLIKINIKIKNYNIIRMVMLINLVFIVSMIGTSSLQWEQSMLVYWLFIIYFNNKTKDSYQKYKRII